MKQMHKEVSESLKVLSFYMGSNKPKLESPSRT